MSDTIQVVRVSDDDLLVGEIVFYPEDVIELTQERRDVAGQAADGTLNGEDYVETRLVSGWRANR